MILSALGSVFGEQKVEASGDLLTMVVGLVFRGFRRTVACKGGFERLFPGKWAFAGFKGVEVPS